jgi:hypothetical protein
MDSHPSRRSALKTLGTVAIASVAPVGADTIQTAAALDASLLTPSFPMRSATREGGAS